MLQLPNTSGEEAHCPDCPEQRAGTLATLAGGSETAIEDVPSVTDRTGSTRRRRDRDFLATARKCRCSRMSAFTWFRGHSKGRRKKVATKASPSSAYRAAHGHRFSNPTLLEQARRTAAYGPSQERIEFSARRVGCARGRAVRRFPCDEASCRACARARARGSACRVGRASLALPALGEGEARTTGRARVDAGDALEEVCGAAFSKEDTRGACGDITC